MGCRHSTNVSEEEPISEEPVQKRSRTPSRRPSVGQWYYVVPAEYAVPKPQPRRISQLSHRSSASSSPTVGPVADCEVSSPVVTPVARHDGARGKVLACEGGVGEVGTIVTLECKEDDAFAESQLWMLTPTVHSGPLVNGQELSATVSFCLSPMIAPELILTVDVCEDPDSSHLSRPPYLDKRFNPAGSCARFCRGKQQALQFQTLGTAAGTNGELLRLFVPSTNPAEEVPLALHITRNALGHPQDVVVSPATSEGQSQQQFVLISWKHR